MKKQNLGFWTANKTDPTANSFVSTVFSILLCILLFPVMFLIAVLKASEK